MGTTYPVPANGQSYGLLNDVEELGRPFAPFMGDGSDRSQTPPSPNASQSQLYRGSAAGAMQYGDGAPGLPRTGSTAAMSMRAPFLSPASRPTSSLWAPPSVPYAYPPASGSSSGLNTYVGSGSALYAAGQYPSYQDIQAQLRKAKPVMPSSRLPEKLTTEDKPWMQIKDKRSCASWWLTFMGMVAGVAGAAVLCYFSWTSVLLLSNSDLCQVFSEDWSNGYTNNWVADVELGGFGNGEFQMTTTDSKNIYTQNNELYIMPTLTSEDIGYGSVLDGYTYKLSGCTTTNATACSVTSSNKSYTVINPVQTARISTRGKASLKYGRVEVVAKIPTGDWLWPAIWMLPVNNTYGNWPMSGEIDLMEARGNSPAYPAQGTNYVRASLNYGVLPGVQTHLFGWWEDKRSAFSEQFHTYALEWTDGWMRLYVDSRLQAMMNIKITGKGGKSFYDQGNYPSTATNGSNTEVVVQDIWSEAGGGPNAPYDQEFYLILDVAAGGTSGWFPDNVGGKPWYDGSATAMREFALAQDTWSATWPSDADDRAFRVGSVKMWKIGAC
ncbi:glycoside hydrolase family 16 protein [Postia placenta MAD-698-R-SB12]|uniref:Glycoside hydrolase family 16 protein n=1 Tax=Postia placenta MAD-698-R-SB12 TaxID=670580 RepID=A0A1X6N180_9APHY|nr:glycoside hydrolase family 16 protein [Postia placenta MAD-698-R-SB12]OSX62213.1 glycoside hydrolase family 16 protein [Postia placenta MAD-698-R-SB12]